MEHAPEYDRLVIHPDESLTSRSLGGGTSERSVGGPFTASVTDIEPIFRRQFEGGVPRTQRIKTSHRHTILTLANTATRQEKSQLKSGRRALTELDMRAREQEVASLTHHLVVSIQPQTQLPTRAPKRFNTPTSMFAGGSTARREAKGHTEVTASTGHNTTTNGHAATNSVHTRDDDLIHQLPKPMPKQSVPTRHSIPSYRYDTGFQSSAGTVEPQYTTRIIAQQPAKLYKSFPPALSGKRLSGRSNEAATTFPQDAYRFRLQTQPSSHEVLARRTINGPIQLSLYTRHRPITHTSRINPFTGLSIREVNNVQTFVSSSAVPLTTRLSGKREAFSTLKQ